MQRSADAVTDGVDPADVVLEMPVASEDEEDDDGEEGDGDDDADDDRRQHDVRQPGGRQRRNDGDPF